tara:strand:- start:1247 stop:1852 length:606 start_codon:yes stop_codon:yes gene_type:complete
MNKFFISILIVSTLTANKTSYWSLGVSINNKNSKQVVRKELSLNNLTVQPSSIENNKTTYTLNKNYIISPEKNYNNNDLNNSLERVEKDNIKELMANDEYFEAAKKLILLNQEDINSIFDNQNDYYYCSSLIYYNLGNKNEAQLSIENISNRENRPEIIFLEALILRGIDNEKSTFLLNSIISNFPDNDYAEYSKNILEDN